MNRLPLLMLGAVVSLTAAGCASRACNPCQPSTGCCTPSYGTPTYGAPVVVPGAVNSGPIYMQPQTVVPGPA